MQSPPNKVKMRSKCKNQAIIFIISSGSKKATKNVMGHLYELSSVKKNELYGCSFAQRCILKKQSRTFLTDQREVNRTKTRNNMFFLILFGFYHVFLTGLTAAKNNIQFQPYRSKKNLVRLIRNYSPINICCVAPKVQY